MTITKEQQQKIMREIRLLRDALGRRTASIERLKKERVEIGRQLDNAYDLLDRLKRGDHV